MISSPNSSLLFSVITGLIPSIKASVGRGQVVVINIVEKMLIFSLRRKANSPKSVVQKILSRCSMFKLLYLRDFKLDNFQQAVNRKF